MAETGSSVPRRQLGRYLRQAREEAGIALDAAARELEISRARMYRIEGGQSSVRKVDVEAMCGLYKATPELTEALVSLAKESKAKGWWHPYGDVVPAWFDLYLGLEAASNRLRQYEPGLIPGLLQTAEYAAAIFRSWGMDEDAVEQATAVRIERQRLLERRRPAAPRLEVIIDEAVLRRPVPDLDSMRDQLARLVAANRSGISVRVLPFLAGPHRASLAGSFVILDFPRNGSRMPEPTTVYSESLTGALYLDRPQEVESYADAWNGRTAAALSEDESADLMARMIKENYSA